MNFRQLVRDYFTFNRNERKGIIVLLVLILLLAVANKLIFYLEKPATIDKVLLDSAKRELGRFNDSIYANANLKTLFFFNPNTIDSLALDSLNVPETVKSNLLKFRQKGGIIKVVADFKKIYGVTDPLFEQISPFLLLENTHSQVAPDISESVFFKFDPNTATDQDFVRLGFSEKQISSIRKYMVKSGVFRTKEDFLKLNVITDKQKKALSEWIQIKAEPQSEVRRSEPNLLIEINSADTVQFKQLPGIGSVLAKRIVKYRDLLGGFYSIDQLREVYGLNEQTFGLIENKVRVEPSRIKKIDLNFSDLNELSRHPYLQKNLASKIIKFRSKNGSFKNMIVLRDSMILNIEEYNRIKPYF